MQQQAARKPWFIELARKRPQRYFYRHGRPPGLTCLQHTAGPTTQLHKLRRQLHGTMHTRQVGSS
jgi:hypothetical protein